MVGFCGILGIDEAKYHLTIKDIARWKDIVSNFKGKLVKMIKDLSSRFVDYSISFVFRQGLLHWGCEMICYN